MLFLALLLVLFSTFPWLPFPSFLVLLVPPMPLLRHFFLSAQCTSVQSFDHRPWILSRIVSIGFISNARRNHVRRRYAHPVVRFVLLRPSVGSIRVCSMGLPCCPSENAQMDASGTIPLSCSHKKIACWNSVRLKLIFGFFCARTPSVAAPRQGRGCARSAMAWLQLRRRTCSRSGMMQVMISPFLELGRRRCWKGTEEDNASAAAEAQARKHSRTPPTAKKAGVDSEAEPRRKRRHCHGASVAIGDHARDV